MTTIATLVARFTDAEHALEAARREWNALPTVQARLTSGLNLTALDDAVHAAARALLAEAADRHRIEERSVVYLCLDDKGAWTIDSPTFDGYSLEGYEDGPLNSACECDDKDECEAVRRAATAVPLPTGDQLLALLGASR